MATSCPGWSDCSCSSWAASSSSLCAHETIGAPSMLSSRVPSAYCCCPPSTSRRATRCSSYWMEVEGGQHQYDEGPRDDSIDVVPIVSCAHKLEDEAAQDEHEQSDQPGHDV